MDTPHITISRRAMLAAGATLPFALPGEVFAQASAPSKSPLEDFFRRPALSSVSLSPDGRAVAAIRDVNGRRNIFVFDLASRKSTIVTNFRDSDVRSVGWVNNQRLHFTMIDLARGLGDQIGSGLFVIDKDGSDFRPLAERSGISEGGRLMPAGTAYLRRHTQDGQPTEDIYVVTGSLQARGRIATNVHRLNTTTGQARLITLGGPGEVQGWVLDGQHVPRAATSTSSRDGATTVYFRENAEATWRGIARIEVGDSTGGFLPVVFDHQGRLIVVAHNGKDTRAYYYWDAASGKIDREPFFAIEGFDVSGDGDDFRFERNEKGDAVLVGIDYEAERRGTFWIDPKFQALQAGVDQALPDAVNMLRFDRSGKAPGVALVASTSDREPGRYLLLDVKTNQLEQIARARSWIRPETQQPTRFLRYAARDGMSIPAQITTPPGPGPHPMVVLHYGGPWVRPIHWGWDQNVQFLVSRGYAVFMPAPRASTGFGDRLFRAGWKQWGLGMQDDVTDGVKRLIADGVADPKRICIAGASYGGYMTMMGLVKDPDLYRCGINWIGVTDPSFMLTVTWTDFNEIDAARFSLPLLVGDAEKDKEQFRQTSAVERAAEIKAPVLMAYGGLDRRVPIVNGDRMRDALRRHDKPHEWVVYRDEGHGWLKLENELDFWKRVEAFLKTHMPA